MWGLQGELSRGVCGTHYYKNDYQWQMFDQVLLRSELLNNFDDDSLQIIVSDGQTNFLKLNGKINV